MPVTAMFAKIAVSVAVAFLGAYPLALASGLMGRVEPSHRSFDDVFIVWSGIILFFLTLSLIGPTLRLIHTIVATLKQVEERPGPTVALTMLCLGSLCAISSLVIQSNAGPQVAKGVAMELNGFSGNAHVVPQLSVSGSLALGILTILTFLLGASLIGLGTWACLKPSPRTTVSSVKPAVPEMEEAMS